MPDNYTVADFPALYAWMGDDEFGSGQIGIKQGITPLGCIPLVAVREIKMGALAVQMKRQAEEYGKTIRLIRYVPEEIILTVE